MVKTARSTPPSTTKKIPFFISLGPPLNDLPHSFPQIAAWLIPLFPSPALLTYNGSLSICMALVPCFSFLALIIAWAYRIYLFSVSPLSLWGEGLCFNHCGINWAQKRAWCIEGAQWVALNEWGVNEFSFSLQSCSLLLGPSGRSWKKMAAQNQISVTPPTSIQALNYWLI